MANDQISHAADYAPLIIGYNNGAAVRLSRRGQMSIDVDAGHVRNAGYLNGKPSIVLIIFRQPGANIIQTVDRIRSQLPFLKATIPQGDGDDGGDGSHHDDPRLGGQCRADADHRRSCW